jgi:hypothetical protein
MANESTRKGTSVTIISIPSINEILAALGKVAKMGKHEPLTITYQEFVDNPSDRTLVLNAMTGLSTHPFSEHLKLEALDEHWVAVTVSFKAPGYGDFATIERP